MKSMPSMLHDSSGFKKILNGTPAGHSTEVWIPPILQQNSGLETFGRFTARPKPTPHPNTRLNATKDD
jgi:hypothetical protein